MLADNSQAFASGPSRHLARRLMSDSARASPTCRRLRNPLRKESLDLSRETICSSAVGGRVLLPLMRSGSRHTSPHASYKRESQDHSNPERSRTRLRYAEHVAAIAVDPIAVVALLGELAHAVATGHEVAGVANVVLVEVRLVDVGDRRAVVEGIGEAIDVAVGSSRDYEVRSASLSVGAVFVSEARAKSPPIAVDTCSRAEDGLGAGGTQIRNRREQALDVRTCVRADGRLYTVSLARAKTLIHVARAISVHPWLRNAELLAATAGAPRLAAATLSA